MPAGVEIHGESAESCQDREAVYAVFFNSFTFAGLSPPGLGRCDLAKKRRQAQQRQVPAFLLSGSNRLAGKALALESGINNVNEDFFQAPDDDYPGFRWSLSYEQLLPGRPPRFFHRHELTVGLKDTEDLFITSQTGVNFPLKNNFQATLRCYDYDWDNTPADDKKQSNSAYIVTLGYRW